MKPLIVSLLIAGLCASAVAQESGPLTGDEIKATTPGKTILRKRSNGGLTTWAINADGTVTVTHYSAPGSKQRTKGAAGTWKVTDDDRICVTENWPDEAVEHCSKLIQRSDGTVETFNGAAE